MKTRASISLGTAIGPLSPAGSHGRARRRRGQWAFTLVEVMIALAIFFVSIFYILELVSRNLRMAQGLQRVDVDIGSLAAELSLTNNLVEGVESGELGELYPGYRWRRETTIFGSNGLFQVDFTVTGPGEHNRPFETSLSILLYKPGSTLRAGSGGRR